MRRTGDYDVGAEFCNVHFGAWGGEAAGHVVAGGLGDDEVGGAVVEDYG